MNTLTKSKAKTLGDWGYLAVEKHIRKTLKYESDVLKDKEPEALHQMRVGMRRLRSAIAGFAPALSLPKAARDRNVAKVARCLGELRDLDVLQETLKSQYYPVLPETEQKVLDDVLDALKKQRKKTLEQVKETLTDKNYKKLKQAFQDWLDEPSYKDLALIPIQEVLPDLLLPEISNFLLHPGWVLGVKTKKENVEVLPNLSLKQVDQLLSKQGVILHDLRKQSKRSRYQMELFTNFYGSNYNQYLSDIKKIQEVLGQIQDSVVLGEFLTNTLDAEIESKISTFTTKLSQSRYQAWQEWQSLQEKYLKPETRQGLHQVVLNPIELVKLN